MTKRWLYILISVPFILGLIFGSFYDVEISNALYSNPSTNTFGLIFSAFVPLVSYLFLAFWSGYAFYFGLIQKKLIHKLVCFVLALVAIGTALYFSLDKNGSVNAYGDDRYALLAHLIVLPVCGLLSVGGYFAAKKYKNVAFLYVTLLLLIGYAAAIIPCTQITKNIMRRPRYRTLLVDSEFYFAQASYHNWWEPFKEYKALEAEFGHDAISEHFKSFPSGHTGEAAFNMFALPSLALLFPKLKGKEFWLTFVGLLYTIAMALSRITMGAHFLSDISVGALLTIICCIIANEIGLFIKKKVEN